MAGPTDQLVVSRWLAANPILPDGPDVNSLEAVVQLITGIPFASVISGGLGLDAACKFTDLRQWKSTSGNVGCRFRVEGGAGGSTECAIIMNRTTGFLHFYKNNGSEASPVWYGGFWIDVKNSHMKITYGVDPFDGGASPPDPYTLITKQYADDNYAAIGGGGGGGSSVLFQGYHSMTGIGAGDNQVPDWTEVHDPEGIHTPGSPNLVIPAGGGSYTILLTCQPGGAASGSTVTYLKLYNGAAYLTGQGARNWSGYLQTAHLHQVFAFSGAEAINAKVNNSNEYASARIDITILEA